MNKGIHLLFFCFSLLFGKSIFSQVTFPENGPRNTSHNYYVFQNANIVKSAGEIIENASLVIRDGRIISVGASTEIPKNAVVYDLKGYWIYPSFIELDSEYGLKSSPKKAGNSWRKKPQYDSKTKGAYNWNEAIRPEYDASLEFHTNNKKSDGLRKKGFGSVLTHKHDGIMRGTSVLVFTGNEKDNFSIIEEKVAQHYSFSKGSSKQAYPSSLMGSIALLRQTLYDAKWYASESENKEINLSLEALNLNKDLPVIFESIDYLTSLRADKVGDEFEMEFVLKGSGDEYKRINEIEGTAASFIVPIKFPLPYNLNNSFDAVDISLSQMKHWELAPFNARIMRDADISFALTANGLKEKEFWSSLETLLSTGLEHDDILNYLTSVPAEIIGMENELGRIENGYLANFLIFSDKFLEKKSVLQENWVNGKQYIINERKIDIRGEYNLNVNKNGGMLLIVEGEKNNPKAKIKKAKKDVSVTLNLVGNEISIAYSIEENKPVLLSGNVNDEESRIWAGKGQLSNGQWVDWAAIKQPKKEQIDTSKADSTKNPIPRVSYPLTSYGFDSLPDESYVIFKHATVWTNESEGILENHDVCIADGKIFAIGQSLSKAGLFGSKEVDLTIIDATGKHLTTGIIDEHSHIAISRGVNEGGQAISAEVRIGDVINSDDINIYRQLSGGVTASQLLHGSANPVGGQSALVKMRWGSSPEEMKIQDADGFIKFALGENVKQSNWGEQNKIRYPQTRMGVEQVFYDGFYRAREYGEMMTIYNSGLKTKKNKKNAPIEPRKDLELEALQEILEGTRFITCHSYIQSEINMLMHVSDSMGFRVNTFTHILEGYKVADKMKAHGVGASTFSDWWAYKYEVNDAIPYNAAILSEQGIVTAINSDDAEMGRRLNQEAAKGVKYGGMSQAEAWKMVTLNPAILLHLDDRMGSMKVGKDADVVLWTDNPLSVNAKVIQTYIDGKLLFDAERDRQMREDIVKERARLITKMIGEKSKKGKGRKIEKEKQIEYHCDSEEEEYDEEL